ncbi:MAG: hypothetical protein IJO20_03880 [Ruminococcus sp.]|nr:hypothetical protein [Ruminococcus sp.]
MDNLEITAKLPHIGLDPDEIPKVDLEKIRNSEEAYLMLLNSMKISSNAYQDASTKVTELNEKIIQLEKKNSDRLNSVIIMTVAEIITSIGVGGMFTEYATGFIFVIFAGLIMTALSLYLNFKK